MKKRPISFAATFLTIVSITHLAPQPARALDRHWNAASGLWRGASNWSPTGAPEPSDNVFMDHFAAGVGGSARIDSTTTPAVTSVTVSKGNSLTTFDPRGDGAVGSLLCGTDLILGTASTSGTLNVTRPSDFFGAYPGGVTVVDELRLGVLSGSGVVNQNAGTVAVGTRLTLGDSSSPTSEFKGFGRYELSAGTLRAPSIYLGYENDSVGVFNLSGSGHVITNNLTVGRNVTGQFNEGVGTFTQSGGQVNVSEVLEVGEWSNGLLPGFRNKGRYTLNGGSLNASWLEVNPDNTLAYNGGALSVATLVVGRSTAATLDPFNARVLLSSGGDKTIDTTFFVVYPESVIDLNDNAMTSRANGGSQIRTTIQRGYSNGAWISDGITSTAARLDPQHITAIGYAFSAGKWNIKYTYFGDTDLNGIVNFDDYARIDAGFNNAGNDWFHGDFDYNGVVNFDDYALIDLAFNTQGAPLTSPVPEPASAAHALVLLLLGRRRRSH